MTDLEELLRTVPLLPGAPLTLPPSAAAEVWKIGRVRRRRRLAATGVVGTAAVAAAVLVAAVATHRATGATLDQDSITRPACSGPASAPVPSGTPGVPQPAADQDGRDLPGYRISSLPAGYAQRGRVMVTKPRSGSPVTTYSTGFSGPLPNDPTVTVTLAIDSGGPVGRPGETVLVTPTGTAFEQTQDAGGLHFDIVTWNPRSGEQLIVQAMSPIGTSQARSVAETIALGIVQDPCTSPATNPADAGSPVAIMDGHVVTYLPNRP